MSPTTPRVFVLHSLTDAAGQRVTAELSRDFDVGGSADLRGELPPALGLRDVLADFDAVVAVLPPPGNRDRTNVMFEVGVAVGVASRVLLVTASERLPSRLHGLPFLAYDSLSVLRARVAELLAAEAYAPTAAAAKLVTSRSAPDVLADRTVPAPQRQSAPGLSRFADANSIIEFLAEIVRAREGQVLIPTEGGATSSVDRPDLVLWVDGLQATFGLPLPVEIVAKATSVSQIRKRLIRVMDGTGASSLLVVSHLDAPPTAWSDGNRLMLIVGADALMERLSAASVPDALTALLEEANRVLF